MHVYIYMSYILLESVLFLEMLFTAPSVNKNWCIGRALDDNIIIWYKCMCTGENDKYVFRSSPYVYLYNVLILLHIIRATAATTTCWRRSFFVGLTGRMLLRNVSISRSSRTIILYLIIYCTIWVDNVICDTCRYLKIRNVGTIITLCIKERNTRVIYFVSNSLK